MQPVTLLIKPASSLCNLRCEYCFYHSVSKSRKMESYGLMSEEVLETLVKKTFELAKGYCTFGFQGGEPTLIGLDFYKKLITLQKKYNVNNVQVINTIQTNGTTIDGNWAQFFAKNKFLVGVSIDGTARIHNKLRVDFAERGTLKKTMETIRLFDKYSVDYNVLCVVSKLVAQHAKQVYCFFRDHNIKYLQFIPCLNPLGDEDVKYDFTLSNEDYSEFLKTTFDLWFSDLFTTSPISIRAFDNYIDIIAGHPPESCNMNGFCHGYLLIESDGTTYPCDFYCLDQYKIGNIMEDSLENMLSSEVTSKFINESKHVDPKCKACKWRKMCRGGCRRNREPFINGKPALNIYCEAYYDFFEHVYPRMEGIVKNLMEKR